MRSYTLNIADYNILLQAKGDNLSLVPSPPQESFISNTRDYDIALNISRANVKIFEGAEIVFRAPYVEEINGVAVKKNDKFWTVYKHGDYILVHTSMPLSESINEALLIIRPGEKAWDIIIDSNVDNINPIEYPLDGLLIYYLTALKGDIFIHGSGVQYQGKGYLFSGPSGKGKTTIARIFNEKGAGVVHDDRLIIRKKEESFILYNTPVYNNEKNNSCVLNAIYLIEHSDKNRMEVPDNVESLTSVMSNCIQHHWNSALIGTLTGAIMDLCEHVDIRKLGFVPDESVINFIINEQA